MNVFVALLLAAAATYLLRISMVVAGDRLSGVLAAMGPRLGLVGPAVMGAIVASALFVQRGSGTMPATIDLVPVAVALAVVRWTGKVAFALAVGLPIYWLGALLA